MQMSVKESVKQALYSAYTGAMRLVSTEAATVANANEACFKDFQLIEIPEVMRTRMNAPAGAALMQRWFNSRAFTISEAMIHGRVDFRAISRQNIDTAAVKMSWVAGFARTQRALAMMEAHRAATPAAARELKRVLMRAGALTNKRMALGTSPDVIDLHETAHLNFMTVELADSTDPLDCALGSFSLHMAASGSVQPVARTSAGATHEVEITALHFYVRDNYEFSGEDEPLGHWGRDGASRMPSSGKVFVENKSFREWRTRHGRGGDFALFSDVMSKRLVRPLKITIQEDVMRRILSLITLLPVSTLTVFFFIGYANVTDTISMKMGASAIYQVAFWLACSGMVLLFTGVAFRFFAARWITIASLLSCAGFIVFSLATYPANNDAHDGPAWSRSVDELYALLAVTSLLLLLAVFEPRIRTFVRQRMERA